MSRITKLVAVGVAAALVLAACGTSAAPAAGKRVVHMSAVEYKGSTEVAKEPFPAAPVPEGDGYRLKEPVDGKWETSTYRWEPGQVIVYQGDQVELHIWGVNGAEHPSTIEGYDRAFTVKRGQLTTVSFTADRAGIFRIICPVHDPSMTGTLIVLPRT
ncbi:MAG TPA: hypothetical protein VMJ92_00410 [Candidatus Limnocylindrales bacterium]|nr:hypothetical protein [Candidatus Limnocylindrales bacterium]